MYNTPVPSQILLHEVLRQMIEESNFQSEEELLQELNLSKTARSILTAAGITLATLTGAFTKGSAQTAAPLDTIILKTTKVSPGDVLPGGSIVMNTGKVSIENLVKGTIDSETGGSALDKVHAVLSHKNLSKDFADLIDKALKDFRAEGYTPDVTDIKVNITVKGDSVFTNASCKIIQSQDGKAYTIFSSRGAIGKKGSDYQTRYNSNVNGLEGRLAKLKGGSAKKVDTKNITFTINGQEYGLIQSFYVASTAEDDSISDLLIPLSADTLSARKTDKVAEYQAPSSPSNLAPESDKNDEGFAITDIPGTTSATTFLELGQKVEREISAALKKLPGGGGKVEKYEPSFSNGKYTVKWEVTNAYGKEVNAFTRRGNINTTLQAAKKDVSTQVYDKAIPALKAKGYTITSVMDTGGIKLPDGRYWFEMAVNMTAPTVQESKLTLEAVNRFKLLAGIN